MNVSSHVLLEAPSTSNLFQHSDLRNTAVFFFVFFFLSSFRDKVSNGTWGWVKNKFVPINRNLHLKDPKSIVQILCLSFYAYF